MRGLFYTFMLLIFTSACNTSIQLVGESSSNRNETNTNGNFPNVTVNNYEKEIFLLVNEHRLSINLNKLKWHDTAIVESQDHSQDMASFRVPFGHTGLNARIDRIKSKESDTILASGENVAQNSSAQKAFKAWLNSPGHRKNIEGNFTHTGVGAKLSGNGSWYFTQIFLRK